MKKYEFYAICGEYLIDVDVALENEKVREALRSEDEKALITALESEF